MSQKQGSKTRQGERRYRPKTGRAPSLASWQIKLAARLGMLDAPGVYPLVLIVEDDGKRSVVVESGQTEELGR